MPIPVIPADAPAPGVIVTAAADALALAAADRFLELAREAIATQGRFTVALSGGSTPEKMYALLAAPERRSAIPWEQVFVFLGDERFVPAENPWSNYGMAKRALLDPIAFPESNRFPMPTPPGVTDLGAAAFRYTDVLATFFQAPGLAEPPAFDLILLGLGDDGHTASLFPGKPALEVSTGWVTGTPPGVLPPPVDRLTLTFPVLNAAKNVLFLVGGEKKADVLQAILEGGSDPATHPAAAVRPRNGSLTYLLDAAAAAKLTRPHSAAGGEGTHGSPS